MDKISYLLTFTSILIAIGVSDIVISLHRLISNHKIIKWHWLPILWTLNIFLALIYYWFVAFVFADFELANTGIGFVSIILPQLTLLFLALAILPDKISDTGVNLLDHFFNRRKYIGILLIIHFWSIWIIRILEYSVIQEVSFNPKYGLAVFSLLLFSILVLSKKIWLHAIPALIVLVYFLIFLTTSNLNL